MYLFLDFDGVLHPESATVEQLFCCRHLLWDVLRENNRIQVVLSTSWREHYPFSDLVGFVTQGGGEDLVSRIVGATPSISVAPLADDYRRREIECLAWLEANGKAGARWLALDDIAYWFSYGSAQAPSPLYLVSYISGLVPEDVPKILERLGRGK